MYHATLVLALVFPIFAVASPLAWDGAPAYTGASNSVNGGSATGGGGINLIKILDHNGAPAGTTQTGDAEGGKGGNRFTSGLPAGLLGRASKAKTAGGSGGGAAYSGASGTAEGGGSQTDPELTLLSVLSDSAGPGGFSGSGGALGGAAGNIL